MLQAGELGYYIQKSAHLITLIANENLENLGITLSQMRMLRCLWETDGLTQKELQQRLLIKASSVTGLLEQLLKKELVRKQGDLFDGRTNHIFLTEAGRKVKEPCLASFARLEKILVQDLNHQQKQEMINLLEKIFKNLRTIKGDQYE